MRILPIIFAIIAFAPVGRASQYWFDREGDDWPENMNPHWERVWGDLYGQYHGPGARRTLEDGVLTYDSLYTDPVFDVYVMSRQGQMDPGPAEMFVMEWRLKVDAVQGDYDPQVAFISDQSHGIALSYAVDHIVSDWEGLLNIPFAPNEWHDYHVESSDMQHYDLFIDGELAHQGSFGEVVSRSQVEFGDVWVTANSLHHWDYLRFGVIPEPSTGLALGLATSRLKFSTVAGLS